MYYKRNTKKCLILKILMNFKVIDRRGSKNSIVYKKEFKNLHFIHPIFLRFITVYNRGMTFLSYVKSTI